MEDKSETKQNKKQTLSFAFALIAAAGAVFFCAQLIRLAVLPGKYIIVACVLIIAVTAALCAMQFCCKYKVLVRAAAVLAAAVLLAGGIALSDASKIIENINTVPHFSDDIGIFVKQDDPAQSIKDVKNYRLGILSVIEREKTDAALEYLTEELGFAPEMEEYDSIISLAEAMENDRADALLINGGLLSLLDEESGHYDFSQNLRLLAAIPYVINSPAAEEVPDETPENQPDIIEAPFAVYITGNDNFGSLDIRGRSDVNIIMAVDPTEHEILLVSTPRDYFVPLSINGEYDKLTHAAIYGTTCSRDTLADFYGIPINYYVRINFSGFINIIDALGGVDVVNDIEFAVDDFYYPEGETHLSGAAALRYCRERHMFAGGDRVRGRHQQAVIHGLIDRLCSTAVLSGYRDLMEAVSGSFETDIGADNISALVRMQLESGKGWEITNLNADGEGSMGNCYSMPGYVVYRMIPDEETVSSISSALQEFLKVN